MTPKQKYDERKRLRIENDLRAEQRRKSHMDREDEIDQRFTRILMAMERVADVMELWADIQADGEAMSETVAAGAVRGMALEEAAQTIEAAAEGGDEFYWHDCAEHAANIRALKGSPSSEWDRAIEAAAAVCQATDPEKPANWLHRREDVPAAIRALKWSNP